MRSARSLISVLSSVVIFVHAFPSSLSKRFEIAAYVKAPVVSGLGDSGGLGEVGEWSSWVMIRSAMALSMEEAGENWLISLVVWGRI